jgi:hypothetical protein
VKTKVSATKRLEQPGAYGAPSVSEQILRSRTPVRAFGMSHLLWTNRSSGRFGNSLGRPVVFVEEGEILRFAILAADAYASEMGPTYFEVMFSKSGSPQSEYWRVCIELDDKDKALLNSHTSTELRTQSVVWRSGVLDLLPKGLDDCWPRFGTVLMHNVIGTWSGEIKPMIGKDGHKAWIIPRV